MTKLKCPNCTTSEYVKYTGNDKPSESGEMYDVKIYKCEKCGIEFDDEEIKWHS